MSWSAADVMVAQRESSVVKTARARPASRR